MKEVLQDFDLLLQKKKLKFSATIIGGTALILLNIINRATKDVDCLEPKIPIEVQKAAEEFAKKQTQQGSPLSEHWLNNGPETLQYELPKGWQKRTIPLYEGKNLKLKTLGRIDLLRSKLFAYCDRQQDLYDCLALKPKLSELKKCHDWLIERDMNPLWPEHVFKSLQQLAKELNYDFNI